MARHKSAVQSRDAQVMDLRTSHAELRRDCERRLLRLGALASMEFALSVAILAGRCGARRVGSRQRRAAAAPSDRDRHLAAARGALLVADGRRRCQGRDPAAAGALVRGRRARRPTGAQPAAAGVTSVRKYKRRSVQRGAGARRPPGLRLPVSRVGSFARPLCCAISREQVNKCQSLFLVSQ